MPAMFASEEKEARPAISSKPIQAPSTAEAKGEVAEVEPRSTGEAIRADGALHAGRIWVSAAEMDDDAGWSGEAEVNEDAEPEAEFETESGPAPEMEDIDEVEDAEPVFEHRREPELVPVAASVFDDDFFRAGSVRGGAAISNQKPGTAVEMARVSDEPGREVRLFAGASATHSEHSESDELDIPAFLRRSR
jgi:hypothetical protein